MSVINSLELKVNPFLQKIKLFLVKIYLFPAKTANCPFSAKIGKLTANITCTLDNSYVSSVALV